MTPYILQSKQYLSGADSAVDPLLLEFPGLLLIQEVLL